MNCCKKKKQDRRHIREEVKNDNPEVHQAGIHTENQDKEMQDRNKNKPKSRIREEVKRSEVEDEGNYDEESDEGEDDEVY